MGRFTLKRSVWNLAGRLRRPSGQPGALGFNDLVDLADAARDRRDFGGAASLYEAALRLDAANAPIQVQCGHMYKESGRMDAAERHYLAAQALAPEDADLNLQLGHFYKTAGQIGEAENFYRRALDLAPDLVDASTELMELTASGSMSTARRSSAIGKGAHFSRQPWAKRFNVLDFRTLTPDLGERVTSRDEALDLFVAEGIDRLAPIALDAPFEPAFYRFREPALAALSDVEAYRHWLFEGIGRGYPGSEAELLASLHCQGFPTGFDWQSYASSLTPYHGSQPHRRWTALEHLFRTGYLQGRAVPTTGQDEADLFVALADDLKSRGNDEAALRALRRAADLAPDDGAICHKLGDFLSWAKRPAEARLYYEKAYRSGSRHLWTCVHVVGFLVEDRRFAEAYALLAESKAKHAGETVWRDSLQKVADGQFEAALADARAAHRVSDDRRGADLLEAALHAIAEAYRALDELPAPLPPCPDGPVVMFAMTAVPQCRHYRVEQRLAQFDHLGVPVKMFDGLHVADAREALVGARALIVYREPAYPNTIRLILHARAMGVPVFYEIDDLIVDFDYYPGPFEPLQGQLEHDEFIGLMTGVTLYRFALRLCDRAIASTDQLATHLAPLTRDKDCVVVLNGVDARNTPFLDTPLRTRRPDDDVFIFYGSGARAHNLNFNVTVAPALARILEQRPRVRLVIAGFLDLDSSLARYADRIVRLPFCRDLKAYWALLSEVDINIAVLVPGEMNDCKSEIKWLEAAACGVPSVVSSSASYRRALRDGVDALLVDSPEGWEPALLSLIDAPRRRTEIAAAARRTALERYALPVLAAELGRTFAPAAEVPPALDGARRRTRVLLVHVLFPPQAFGGATRVVVDNVDDLMRRHGSDFELAVATSDFGAQHPRTRVGRYGEVPVFRFAVTLHDAEVYEDPSVAPFFGDVLDAFRPDVVHFHCIQMLTATIVEVTRERGVPYLITVHDGWWLSRNQFMLDEDYFLKRTPPRALEDADAVPDLPGEARRRHTLFGLLGDAATVTAVSEGFAAYYRERTGLAIRALPNGISPGFVGRARTATPAGQGRVRVAHLGGWAPHKGIHLMQAAFALQPFAHLDVTVVDHRKSSDQAEDQQWGPNTVRVIGKVSQDDMAAFYATIDVLVAPSIWPESFGLITREALACGLWVITSRIGGIGDDVVDGANGFRIDVDGPKGLIDALLAIDADPARYRSPPAIQIKPRLSTDQADDLAQLYQEIAARPRPAARDHADRGGVQERLAGHEPC